MTNLKIAYDDNSESLIKRLMEVVIDRYPTIKLSTFHENLFKERKKAFKLKGEFSARKNPFGVLLNEENKVIKAFYSEANECTFDNIIQTLNNYIPYEHNRYN